MLVLFVIYIYIVYILWILFKSARECQHNNNNITCAAQVFMNVYKGINALYAIYIYNWEFHLIFLRIVY